MNPTRDEADSEPSPLQSRRDVLSVGLLGGAGVLLAGGGIAASLAQAVSARTNQSASSAQATTERRASLYMVVATPDMLGTGDLPAYIPTNPVIPSYATVRVEIANFDDATALTGDLAQFAKVEGTVGGTITTTPMDPKAPNMVGAGQVLAALDAEKVSHTFTVASLGINVPVAPKARTIFTIQTGAPGTHSWRCNDPCGTGTSGWGGAMAKPGYMVGTLTVA